MEVPLKLVTLFAVAALAGMCGSDCLADTAPSAATPGACKQDIQSLCSGVKAGGGRIKQCMKAHAKELSPGCKEAIKEKNQTHAK
jgi:hypothetical protein